MAARKQQREMDRQLKAYGREAMELDPKLRLEDAARGVTLEDHQKSLQLRMPGSKPPKKDAKDPLRDFQDETDETYDGSRHSGRNCWHKQKTIL